MQQRQRYFSSSHHGCGVKCFDDGWQPCIGVEISLWLLLLSFNSVGQEFYSFQWDALLSEAGFLSILFPMTSEPPWVLLCLHRALVIRLVFGSGMMKVTN